MTEPEIVEQSGVPTAVVRATVPVAELPNFFDRSFPTLLWEVYLTEPSPEMDPADLRTELNWPVAAGAAVQGG